VCPSRRTPSCPATPTLRLVQMQIGEVGRLAQVESFTADLLEHEKA
jgi:hypothetical protein